MMDKKYIDWIGFIPLLFLMIFALFCIRAFYQLDEIPTFANSDPKDLNFDAHHILIWFFGIVSILIIPFVIVYDLITKNFTVRNLVKRIFILLFIVFLFFNPFDLVNWFLD